MSHPGGGRADRRGWAVRGLRPVSRFFRLTSRLPPRERPDAAGAFLTLFGFMAGHALLETGRDALFLARLPATRLPWVYLAIALVALLLAEHQSRLLRRLSSRNELSGWLLFAAAGTLGFWGLVAWERVWVYYALYVWTGVLATLVVVRFWTVLGGLFTVTQAKRVYAVVGAGSVLGAIVGSGFARLLTELLPARYLVLAAAVAFLLASPAPRILGRGGPGSFPRARGIGSARQLTRMARLIWSRPYLQRVTVLIVVSAVTFSLIDYVFKSMVDRAVPPAQLGQFFSTVYFSLNVASLAVQLFLVSWLIRRFGVNKALAVVPALLVLGALGVAVGGGLLLAMGLKAADGSFRHSLFRTGMELFFVAIPVELRVRVKPVIDVIGQRGGQVLASIVILGLLTFTTRSSAVAAVAAVTATAWLVLVLDLRRHYLNVFRESLDEEVARARFDFQAPDVRALERLLAALDDPDERVVLAALDLLAAYDKLGAVPGLIMHHPSPAVVDRALELFADGRRTDLLPALELAREHPDPRVRAAAVRTGFVLEADEASLEAALEDPDPAPRATALAGLVAAGRLPSPEAESRIAEIVRRGTLEARLALARAIRQRPARQLEAALAGLLEAREPEVRLEALRAIRDGTGADLVPRLIETLSTRSLREEARAALIRLGDPALAALEAALRDRGGPHAVRRHLPDAIAGFGTVRAAAVLVDHLIDETDGMIRFKILRSLGRLRRRQPTLPLDDAVLRWARGQTLELAFRFLQWRRAIEAAAVHDPATRGRLQRVLILLLSDKQNHALERVFRLLNLETRNDDFFRVYRGLSSPKRSARAGSRELLEHLVVPPERTALLELVEDLYDTVVDPGARRVASDRTSYAQTLRELVASGIESLSSVAAAHAAELGLRELRETIGSVTPLSPEHGEVLAGALATLDGRSGGSG